MTEAEILGKIARGECFSGVSEDDSFFIAVDEWVPYVCAAIHNGGNFRKDLLPKMALSKFERWQEEDPKTGRFISAFPIRIIAHDSRYEYDLNRPPSECIYDSAWGKTVWKSPLTKEDRRVSLEKHRRFYRVLTAVVKRVETQFDRCLVYDMHSFCVRDYPKRSQPLFNLGTKNVDRVRYRQTVESWLHELTRIRLPHVSGRTSENENFQGEGFLLKHLTKRSKNVLVLATEIKKVYCDEKTGDVFPAIMLALREGLKRAVVNTASVFAAGGASHKYGKRQRLLSSTITDDIRTVDERLHKLSRGFDLLDFINPVNKESEKNRFLRSKFRTRPRFRHKPLPIDPIVFKREAYSIPVSRIRDAQIQSMYRDIIEAQVSLVDMLARRGSKDFLFESLKQYGEPDAADLANARYLVHFPVESRPMRPIRAEAAVRRMRATVKLYGQECRVCIGENLSAKAMFSPGRRELQIQQDASFSEGEILALGHHEVGVHLLTTINARSHELKFTRTGMPAYSYTQEGLAIVSEYLSGGMSVSRLRELGCRVLAVRSMIRDYDFKTTFELLVDECGLNPDSAFDVATRAYRGGGLTKDFLYLKGFKDVLNLYRSGDRWRFLLLGKVSLDYLDILEELVSRGFLKKAPLMPIPFRKPKKASAAVEFLVSGIK